MSSILDYKQKYEVEKVKFGEELLKGIGSTATLSFHRKILDKMEEQVITTPLSNGDILMYGSPNEWHLKIAKAIDDEDKKLEQLKSTKLQEFFRFAQQQIQFISSGNDYVVKDTQNGVAYLVKHDDRILRKAVSSIMSEMQIWLNNHVPNEQFYRQQIEHIYYDFLLERQDLVAMLKIANELAVGVEQSIIPIERPAHVEVTELAIGLIPYVGSAVALYESYSGKDIFGYRLTMTERTVLAATAILPTVGRLVKGGKALYTANRMQKLYGRDAAVWSKTIGSGEGISRDAKVFGTFNNAELKVRNSQQLDTAISIETEKALQSSRFARNSISQLNSIVSPSVKDLFEKISSKFSLIGSLDEIAMQRIIQKKNVNHIKGQILEELLENKICNWLRESSSFGKNALGLKATGQLEFVPGHIIRDLNGRQITDGIIIQRMGNSVEVLAIFEAKAGQNAARELSIASTSMSELSKAERIELRAYAKDVYSELLEEARLRGTTVTKTIDDVEKEIILSEKGGQIRRDIERLHGSTIKIAGVETTVAVSPQKTKFFGVVPQGIRFGNIETELKSLGYKFEFLGIEITQSDLQKIAEEIMKANL
jgi:hypothetical protein